MNSNPTAKRILCFGDSYVWGYRPETNHERIPADKRWTGILQVLLGNSYEVIEEGLNSRTLNSDDTRPGKEGRNGQTYLIPCLDTHDPIDLIVLMLGTNELKDSFNTPIEEIEKVVENLYVRIILDRKSQFRNTSPKLILVAPPIIDISKQYANSRYAQSGRKSKMLISIYEEICKRNGCTFLNSSHVVTVGGDGIHLDEEQNRKLAESISKLIVGTV